MQTKRQIQQLLSSAGVSPNKRLGQNFLIDLNLMNLLIDTADIRKNDLVLEVGCGTGSLTEGLAEKAGKVIAVELDRTLADITKHQLAGKKNLEIINTDVLKNKNTIKACIIDKINAARKKTTARFLLVANLPYNVATPVMINLITGPLTVDAMFVTIQKEVADRMTANPGSKSYGALTILLNATGTVKIIKILKPSVFWPKPAVDSAMISFVRNEDKISQIKDMQLFRDCINLFMQHRRKQIKSCTRFAKGQLAKIENWPEIFRQAGINPTRRPAKLSCADYLAIADLCRREKLNNR